MQSPTLRAAKRKYRLEHKEQIRAYNKYYKQKHHAELNKRSLNYYYDHKEELRKKKYMRRLALREGKKRYVHATLSELFTIYRRDPAYFKEKLLTKFNQRTLDMAYAYLDNETTLRKAGEKFNVSYARVGQVVRKVLFRVQQINLRKESMEEKPKNKINTALTQELFDKIKEMLFRGDSNSDITAVTGRSTSTIWAVRHAATLEEYFANGGAAPSLKNIQATKDASPKEKFHFIRLKQMKENFDEVLADFIVKEIATAQEALIAENNRLRAENQSLKEQIEISRGDFINKLKIKLQPTTNHKEGIV